MLKFKSNGDGTCSVCNCSIDATGELVIPKYSYEGDIVTSIYNDAFLKCTSLTSVTIPDSVTIINEWAFSSCTNLMSVTMPQSVTRIEYAAFYGCTALKSITIPDGVTYIGESAFGWCTGLTSVTIPSSVTRIGRYAFNGVANVVYSGESPRHLWGARAVNGYVENGLVYKDSTKKILLACPSTTTGSITIPESVTSIRAWAFFNCTNLKNITIPSSVIYIGKEAFINAGLKKEIAIKATDGNITCRDFQFNIGNWYHEKRAILCATGFHYVENAFDVLNYYYGRIGTDVRFFKVKTNGVSPERQADSKRVCADICLYEEITSYSELLN